MAESAASLGPIQTLFDESRGDVVPLPETLARLYGPLRLDVPPGRPLVISNFVSTLDGVVSLAIPGLAGGEPISGGNQHDVMIMGLLRAVADAVIVGAGSLRTGPTSRLTAEYVFPLLAAEYAELRRRLGKPATPLSVVVTARGSVDLAHPIFSSGEVRALVLTTDGGLDRLAAQKSPPWVVVRSLGSGRGLAPTAILTAIREHQQPCDVVLSEGGPGLTGDFLAVRGLDELFLTLAPQIAGRDGTTRPGFVAGRELAPGDSRWGALLSARRAGQHLFLRYDLRQPTT